MLFFSIQISKFQTSLSFQLSKFRLYVTLPLIPVLNAKLHSSHFMTIPTSHPTQQITEQQQPFSGLLPGLSRLWISAYIYFITIRVKSWSQVWSVLRWRWALFRVVFGGCSKWCSKLKKLIKLTTSVRSENHFFLKFVIIAALAHLDHLAVKDQTSKNCSVRFLRLIPCDWSC